MQVLSLASLLRYFTSFRVEGFGTLPQEKKAWNFNMLSKFTECNSRGRSLLTSPLLGRAITLCGIVYRKGMELKRKYRQLNQVT
jgi:hypothetical protein